MCKGVHDMEYNIPIFYKADFQDSTFSNKISLKSGFEEGVVLSGGGVGLHGWHQRQAVRV